MIYDIRRDLVSLPKLPHILYSHLISSLDNLMMAYIGAETCSCMLIKIQPDATVGRYLFTAKSLYMFRVSQHPSSGVLKTVTAASGTGHTVKYKD